MEEDHEELLQGSDDEDSMSETEDQCCPVASIDEPYLPPMTFFYHTKLEFFITKSLLILSALILLITMPLYISAANERGNVFAVIFINAPLTTIILIVLGVILKFLVSKFKHTKIIMPPMKLWPLLQISSIYTLCGLIYFYSLDRNRVLCHLQDPVKGIILVFSLLYYFFFCRNLMGLHRIFSTTTVIVGLFIAVDYGLCDEFVCRGYDRQKVSDDAGPWSWKVHCIWTGLYMFGLTLLAAFYTLLDRHVIPEKDVDNQNLLPNCFLSTISRSVTVSNGVPLASQSLDRQSQHNIKNKSTVHIALWIQLFSFALVLLTFWIDFIPGVGKGHTVMESLNYTKNGIVAHFLHPGSDSGGLLWYVIVFQVAYVIFLLSSIKFLIFTQSAVFTIATMSSALPLLGVWWSLFYASPTGELVWSPRIRGEFVCSVIGLPIVCIGLGLLCKAHFEDFDKSKNVFKTPENQTT